MNAVDTIRIPDRQFQGMFHISLIARVSYGMGPHTRCKVNLEGDTIAFPLFLFLHEEGNAPTSVQVSIPVLPPEPP